MSFTGDGDKCTDLDCDLFPSHCATTHGAIGSLDPGDVGDDAMFDQYLCSPSPSPSPTPSPDDTTSELSGSTLFDAGRDPSHGFPELYTETPRSTAPEISPESEIARDQDDPCHSANGTCIRLRVRRPKITPALNSRTEANPERKRKGTAIRERGNPGTQREGQGGKRDRSGEGGALIPDLNRQLL